MQKTAGTICVRLKVDYPTVWQYGFPGDVRCVKRMLQ